MSWQCSQNPYFKDNRHRCKESTATSVVEVSSLYNMLYFGQTFSKAKLMFSLIEGEDLKISLVPSKIAEQGFVVTVNLGSCSVQNTGVLVAVNQFYWLTPTVD